MLAVLQNCLRTYRGSPQNSRKNPRVFPTFSRDINYTFPKFIAKVNVVMTFIYQRSFRIISSNITGHQRTVTISEIHKTLFIRSQIPCCVTQIFHQTETILFVKNFPWYPWVFHVRRNPWVLQVLHVCGHPVTSSPNQFHSNYLQLLQFWTSCTVFSSAGLYSRPL